MKTDPNLCPPPAPESAPGRRPSDRPSPVRALSGVVRRIEAVAPSRVARSARQVTQDVSGEFGIEDEAGTGDDISSETSGEFDPYRFGRHQLPYDFLQEALKHPLRAPRDEDLLHETLPPVAAGPATLPPVVIDPEKTLAKGIRLTPEAAELLRGMEPRRGAEPRGLDLAPPAARRSARYRRVVLLAGGVLGTVAIALALRPWVSATTDAASTHLSLPAVAASEAASPEVRRRANDRPEPMMERELGLEGSGPSHRDVAQPERAALVAKDEAPPARNSRGSRSAASASARVDESRASVGIEVAPAVKAPEGDVHAESEEKSPQEALEPAPGRGRDFQLRD